MKKTAHQWCVLRESDDYLVAKTYVNKQSDREGGGGAGSEVWVGGGGERKRQTDRQTDRDRQTDSKTTGRTSTTTLTQWLPPVPYKKEQSNIFKPISSQI